MSTRTRVVVVGPRGRMGALVCAMLEESSEFELALSVDRDDDLASAVRAERPLVAFEATRAGLGFQHARLLLDCGVRPLVATSGVTPDENAHLDAQARELGLGGLVVPNFSLGSWLLMQLGEQAARTFPDVEIVELHHAKKRDAPSGTALETARRLRVACGSEREIPIHSVRLAGLYAHQELHFGSPGETLTLRHDMLGPEAFVPGICAGLRYVQSALGVARGIEHALEGPRRRR